MATHADPTRAAPHGRAKPARAPAQRAAPCVPRPPWAPPLSPAFAVARAAKGDAEAPTPETEPRPASATQAPAGPPEPPRPPNRTGLPDALKSGVEALSGLAMDDVRVHRASPEPAKLGALAYAKGSDIHLAPGQERHLPHEAWHVVQQKQGRVKATTQLKGFAISEGPELEHEADAMGAQASAFGDTPLLQIRLRRVNLAAEGDGSAFGETPIQLARIPVGYDNISTAEDPAQDSLVTTSLTNCIAVAVQDRNTRRAAMAHFNTGPFFDAETWQFEAAPFVALKDTLVSRLTEITPLPPDPVFHVSVGAVWVNMTYGPTRGTWDMRHSLLRTCLAVFNTEPVESGATAEFTLATGAIQGSTLNQMADLPEGWHVAGQPIQAPAPNDQ